MKAEVHGEAFEERKETIMKWATEIRGLDKSQRSVGDNASKAIIELLSLALHKSRLVKEGFQLNHRWFKSKKIGTMLPDFENKAEIVPKMVKLENLCESLSYGKKRPLHEIQEALSLFNELEEKIKKLL